MHAAPEDIAVETGQFLQAVLGGDRVVTPLMLIGYYSEKIAQIPHYFYLDAWPCNPNTKAGEELLVGVSPDYLPVAARS